MGHLWNRSGAVKDFLVLTQKTKLRDGQTQLDLTPEEQFSPSPSWVLRSSRVCCVFPTYSETITAPSTSHKANILPFQWTKLSSAAGGEFGGPGLPPRPASPGCA